jgi:hypothetical protein
VFGPVGSLGPMVRVGRELRDLLRFVILIGEELAWKRKLIGYRVLEQSGAVVSL